jgi:hypothetical protein
MLDGYIDMFDPFAVFDFNQKVRAKIIDPGCL